ncbi:MAG: cytochrome c3 family protein, partial [Candidatus Methylomirabilis sp.]|nr:cytochrome c3 family protein [Deltaproteobacteria bacterium]
LPGETKRLFDEAAEGEFISRRDHFKELLSLKLTARRLDVLLQDRCILCHTDPASQDPPTLFSTDPKAHGSPAHLDIKGFLGDAHFRRGLSCAGCHGGDPSDEDMNDEIYDRWPKAEARETDKTWIPAFCARCHADASFMRGFDPAAPTDQYAKYQESTHGRLLLEKRDSRAAQCVSCHGVHDIQGPKSPLSRVYAKNVPSTCGACHADAERMKGLTLADGSPMPTDQLEKYERSVHGKALLERSDLGAPACNDCHGNHAATPPTAASVEQVCGTCHSGNRELFEGSKHRKVFDDNGWPECAQCHGNHDVEKTSDAMLSTRAGGLCFECHQKHARDNEACVRTADFFHDTITALAEDAHKYGEVVPALAEKGLDVENLGAAVDDLQNTLKQQRSRIHSFDREDFERAAEAGRQGVERAAAEVDGLEREFAFRRKGLFVAVALMALVAGLIYLKIRQIEARRPD